MSDSDSGFHSQDGSVAAEVPAFTRGFVVLAAGMAGAMGWGIRGQYGHETGAMIAGLLVSLVIVLAFCSRAHLLTAMRVVALGTIAISFGGSMTYGQTVGLTHDAPLIGHHGALAWGLFGLAIKGGVWIGFFGLFLGIGLGGMRYSTKELIWVLLASVGMLFLGVALLNQPYVPEERLLPRIYFSDHWRWEPDGDLKPRRECWGGLLFALLFVWAYAAFWKKDRLAKVLMTWGFLGGALGFPAGQSLQAFHAWNREWFQQGAIARWDAHINWWNLMETTFGFVFGVVVALGVWRYRAWIVARPERPAVAWRPAVEGGIIALHLAMVLAWNLESIDALDAVADLALTMGILPIVGIVAGRLWPFFLALPVTLAPIAGKTIREMTYRSLEMPEAVGWIALVAVPIGIAVVLAMKGVRLAGGDRVPAGRYIAMALLTTTWLYFALNFVFFRYPWPWADWTGRTPHALSFLVCALVLTVMARLGLRASGGVDSRSSGCEATLDGGGDSGK